MKKLIQLGLILVLSFSSAITIQADTTSKQQNFFGFDYDSQKPTVQANPEDPAFPGRTNILQDAILGKYPLIDQDDNKVISVEEANAFEGSLILEPGSIVGRTRATLDGIEHFINIEALVITHSDRIYGDIPEGISNLSKLKKLDLSANQLWGEIPTELGMLTELETLNLFSNELEGDVPVEIGDIALLKELNLANNFLETLPETIGNLQHLRELHLDANPLIGLPTNVGSLANLEILTLSEVGLTAVPDKFGNLIQLQELNLSENSLTELPETLKSLVNLQNLNVAHNGLKELPEVFKSLTNLQSLNISYNKLRELPDWLQNLETLKSFWVNSNQITSLTPELYTFLINSQLSPLELQEQELAVKLDEIGTIGDKYTFIGYPVYTQFPSYGEKLTYRLEVPGVAGRKDISDVIVINPETLEVTIPKHELYKVGTYKLIAATNNNLGGGSQIYDSVYTTEFNFKKEDVDLLDVRSNGIVDEETTTIITIDISKIPEFNDLSANDITLIFENPNDTDTIIKGSLRPVVGKEGFYELTVSGTWQEGTTLRVVVDMETAQFEPNEKTVVLHKILEYHVDFDLDGGTSVNPILPQTVVNKHRVIRPEDPTKEGFDFLGWYETQNAQNPWVFDEDLVTQDITLYAKWQLKEYEVILDDGETSVGQTVKHGDKIVKPVDPEQEGYEFGGWYPEGSDTAWDFEHDIVTDDTKLHARWQAKSYTVIFDSRGGNSISDQEVEYKTSVNEPAEPTQAHYDFAGWYQDSDLTKPWDFALDTMPAHNLTLYAKWEGKPHDVTFKDRDTSTTESVRYGDKVIKPVDPEQEGYEFEGWYTDEDFTVAWDFEHDTVQDDTILYAKWQVKSYKVSFDSRGGSAVAGFEVLYKTTIVEPTNPELKGHDFRGWYLDEALTVGWDFNVDTMPAHDIVLYADWELKDYEVIFIDGETSEKESIKYGDKVIKPVDPEQEGYEFGGWYPEGSDTAWDFDNDVVTDDTSLQAKWSAKHYTVIFDAMGGSLVSEQDVAYKEQVVRPLDPTLTNHLFQGWYTTSDFTVGWDFNVDTMPAHDVTLYAKWLKVDSTTHVILAKDITLWMSELDSLDEEEFLSRSEAVISRCVDAAEVTTCEPIALFAMTDTIKVLNHTIEARPGVYSAVVALHVNEDVQTEIRVTVLDVDRPADGNNQGAGTLPQTGVGPNYISYVLLMAGGFLLLSKKRSQSY